MTVSAATASTTVAAAGPATSADPLSKLSGNFGDFLNLLITQLKNQDPTAPTDTNQFTTQLVQFTGVAQQINTNSSLTTLIQSTQGNTLLNSSSLIGRSVEVTSDQLSLQKGAASIGFKTAAPETVNIGIYSPGGVKLTEAAVTSVAGQNRWSWDGKDASGTQLPDGAYKVVATDASGGTVPFTVDGTATGVQRNGTALKVSLGGVQVDFGSVLSVGN